MGLGRRSDAIHWDSKTKQWRKESSSIFLELGGWGARHSWEPRLGLGRWTRFEGWEDDEMGLENGCWREAILRLCIISRFCFFCFFFFFFFFFFCMKSCWDADESVVSLIWSIYNETSVGHFCCDRRGNKRDTGCPRRNVPDFGRVFLMLKYTDITQNTYVQSWTVTEIMAREVWNFDSCYTLVEYQIHIKTGRNMWFLWC